VGRVNGKAAALEVCAEYAIDQPRPCFAIGFAPEELLIFSEIARLFDKSGGEATDRQ
jgi:hypothetical protein